MSKLLKFDELSYDKKYRLLHGGEKDHGHDYIIIYNHKDKVRALFNVSKDKYSGLNRVSLNQSAFIEVDEKFKSYENLDFKIEFTSKSLVIGCQTIDAFTAQLIATDILDHFGTVQ
jgi:hypothetical protein